MKPLLAKDFRIQKRSVIITTMIGLVLFWISGGLPVAMVYPMGCFLVALSLVYGGIGYDETNDSMRFILTLPVSRRNIVAAKFLSSLLIVVAGAILTVIVIQLLSLTLGNWQLPDWTALLGSIAGSVIPVSLLLAIYFIFGYGSLKYLYVGLIFLLVAVGILYTQTDAVQTVLDWAIARGKPLMLLLSFLIGGIVYAAALTCSTWALQRKEF